METTTITTVRVKGHFHVIPTRDAAKYRPEYVKSWSFTHKPYEAKDAIEVGRLLNAAGVYNMQGVGDPVAIELARCQFIVRTIVKGWDREIEGGASLPLTEENIGSLPPDVLRAFGKIIQRGEIVTDEDLDALLIEDPAQEGGKPDEGGKASPKP